MNDEIVCCKECGKKIKRSEGWINQNEYWKIQPQYQHLKIDNIYCSKCGEKNNRRQR